ncbi:MULTISPECIES: phosphoribosylformylglycinamidine synthase subunit PurS [unclassified Candidatus Frackibacter]|jgi:phosphoribosylformylglycinamidine synthase|uniref:phosphoribosylformylglycinamidine synthase subunit PurS n=1 Tax=unclassified Candidatus Frackibacter TaxID=2648818 RepID=UPI000889BDF1|nr:MULTISPECIES: phosphoribosylformylglycinamidine synthase subunit PurS [unclassified Candidatus Frackibacter]SDC44663.1 phosphoribosylformylglycinamidine synthase [Candidatus Frackibacter sp. WG11]SEM64705.1 phosphoribosylformylglycinamidine synthase [Candidatus Frackibacter sp. WG12]SFL67822.1 phosphoribosylformylglycinamidine synthase [Candidatus Frackibacter sp. WG13]
MNWKVEIKTMLKKSILDPQGQAVESGLDALGYKNVSDVNVGKHMELVVEDVESKAEVESQIEEMCERLLANPVIEDYTFQVEEMEG